MKPRVTLITLGVADLARARRFYVEGLGWAASSASADQGASGPSSGEAGRASPHVAFLQLGALALALFPRAELAADAAVPEPGPSTGTFALAQNLASKAEVDGALEDARRAGAKITKPAQDTFWGGYSGYFADPDGHLWELAWNPFWPLGPDGQVTLPP